MSKHKSGPSTGHTPGPWVIFGEDGMQGSNFIRIEKEGEGDICEVQGVWGTRHGISEQKITETTWANARLIAAAPDAKELGDYLSGALEERPDLSDYVDRWRQMSVKDILEVIRLLEVFKKKAEGWHTSETTRTYEMGGDPKIKLPDGLEIKTDGED